MLIQGDARTLPLRDGCVQCVVTSPPYFNLRDYGMANQIGLETSPAAYVAALVDVFREIRRVLAPDGVAWLNLSDSYNSGGGFSPDSPSNQPAARLARGAHDCIEGKRAGFRMPRFNGLKHKDMIGIPWAVAFALRDDGWYLRSDCIWSKGSCMPESVRDRPTRSHEYLFLLAKQPSYYYDADAIAEPCSDAMFQQVEDGYTGLGLKDYAGAGVQNPSDVKARIIANARAKRLGPKGNAVSEDARAAADARMGRGAGWRESPDAYRPTRNKRSVWNINAQNFSGAHFATMPEALVEPCILAGSRLGDLILDPFSGSGTVLAVAERTGRRSVGVDLNPAYHQLAKVRTAQRGLRFEPAVNE